MTAAEDSSRAANEELTRALLNLAANGQRPRCSDPEAHRYWLSEDPAERKMAADWCTGCPILTECAAAGELESFGVWGAIDRGAKALKKHPAPPPKGNP